MPRERLWKFVVALSLFGLGAIPFLPVADRLASVQTHGLLLLLLGVTLVAALGLRQWDAIHVALVSTAYLAAYCLPVLGRLWPLPLLVIFGAYGLVLVSVPGARRSARFWQRGTIDRVSVSWMVSFTLLAAIALITWRYASNVASMVVFS